MSSVVIDREWNNISRASSNQAVYSNRDDGSMVNARPLVDMSAEKIDSRPLFLLGGFKEGVAKTVLFALALGGSFSATPSAAAANSIIKTPVAAERTLSASRKAPSRDAKRASLAEKIYSLGDAPWVAQEDRDALKETIIEAVTFLQLIPNSVVLPKLSYSDDGEIFLLWFFEDGRRAELSFSSELGHGYALFKDGMYYPGEKELVSSAFPSDLLSYLKT